MHLCASEDVKMQSRRCSVILGRQPLRLALTPETRSNKSCAGPSLRNHAGHKLVVIQSCPRLNAPHPPVMPCACECTGSTTVRKVCRTASAPRWMPHALTVRIRCELAAADETWCASAAYICWEMEDVRPAVQVVSASDSKGAAEGITHSQKAAQAQQIGC